jgi:hypothetical protein
MKKLLILLLLLLSILAVLPASAAEIYMAIERGQVLFMVDRHHWELAPNYLKLQAGDVLRVLPGTVGKVFFSNGAEFFLPTGATLTIGERGISQIRGDEKVRTIYKDGMYASEIMPVTGDPLPDYPFPRLIETWPSEQALEQEKEEVDQKGDYLRDRLESASISVMDTDLSKPGTRFTPPVQENTAVSSITTPDQRFEELFREGVSDRDVERLWQEKLRQRRVVEGNISEANVLRSTIATKKAALQDYSLEAAELKKKEKTIRDRYFHLRKYQDRMLETKKRNRG